ncbi:zinc finger and BTB domain-containing protein 16 isoform X2 [Vombatus ursinus]|uniref:zinc finger and BTB domain-containing protein 16 isoform X2 n=1 Tax=Vombatus ursinus TaxID=29139 RepID=UPI000FFCE1CA|nr:zinc finger and BTB domain-containing protein 16 isoform X2 [Vombatus ursinus]
MDLTKMGMIQLQNPSHPTGLLCKANQMRLAGTLCDVVIMVDSQEFHAHRTVLACTSKMFEILFHRNSQHYTLDFLSPKTFQQILEYAYTATLQAKAEDLDDLLYAAEILEIEYLEEQCLKILETIQASDDNDTETTMADGGAEEEEDRKARYLKNIFISKHSIEDSGYAGVAGQHLPGAVAEQNPSVSTSFGLAAMSPTKAAVDSLMSIGQSLLQGALQPPGVPDESNSASVGRHSGVAEVKTEMMQVDEVPGQDSPGAAESSTSGGGGDKAEERSKDGPGTPTRSSVITSARELHYGREESIEQAALPAEASQGPAGRPEHSVASAEKHLGIYSVLPNHKADSVLSMPSSMSSTLHVQPAALAVSMDFSTYGGLLPQGFIQRELFSKLGELAVGMKTENRAMGEQCSVCGAELPDNDAVEQHRKLHSGMKTYGCELCGKRFLDSLRLRMHLLAHSAGAKAFVCDQCGAQFSKEDALETHRQTHTGFREKSS